MHASLEQKQRFQQLFFPEGIALDGNGFVRTAATAPVFSYLRSIEGGNEGLVDQTRASWNRIVTSLRELEAFQHAS